MDNEMKNNLETRFKNNEEWFSDWNDETGELYKVRLEELYQSGVYHIVELLDKSHIENRVTEFLDTLAEYDSIIHIVQTLHSKMAVYNRRIDNTLDDCWEIFMENTTYQPREQLMEMLSLCGVDTTDRF